MANKIISALLIAATVAGAGSAAFAVTPMGQAQTQSVGVISDIDLKDRTLTLADGQVFQLPQGYDLNTFSDGQKVLVTWTQVGGTELASRVVFAN